MMADVKGYGAVETAWPTTRRRSSMPSNRGTGQLELSRGVYRLSRPIVIDLRRSGPFSVTGSEGRARLLMAGPGPACQIVGTHDKSADPETFAKASGLANGCRRSAESSSSAATTRPTGSNWKGRCKRPSRAYRSAAAVSEFTSSNGTATC